MMISVEDPDREVKMKHMDQEGWITKKRNEEEE